MTQQSASPFRSLFKSLLCQPPQRRARSSQSVLLAPEVLEARTLLSVTFGDDSQMTVDEQALATAVRQMSWSQFGQLTAPQVPYLTGEQLQSIPTSEAFNQMTYDARRTISADQVDHLNVRMIGLRGLRPWQINSLTVPQIQSLVPAELGNLTVGLIPVVSLRQIARIPNDGILRRLSIPERAALTDDQVRSLTVSATGLRSLTAVQIEELTVAQIQSLQPVDAQYLSVAQLGQLTDSQLSVIARDWLVDRLNGGDQTVLFSLITTPTPVTTSIGDRTIGQIQALTYGQFRYLAPAQVPYLTSTQLGTIPDGWWLGQFSEAARLVLLPNQIRALNVAATGLSPLSDLQIGWLSTAQIQSVSYSNFNRLQPTQIPNLTATQLGSIPNDWWFRRMSDAARAALTETQVRVLPVGTIGLEGLTNSQVAVLTRDQARVLVYSQFQRLTPRLTALLLPAQIATIPNGWWFDRMSVEARAALTAPQVQALHVDAVGLSGLTASQVGMLSWEQIRTLTYDNFQRLLPVQVPQLATTQIATIPNGWWLDRLTAEARAQLTGDQVRALNVAAVGLSGLNESQVAQLSALQVTQLKYDAFHRLTAAQTPLLTAEQLASIPNDWWFGRLSVAARAALTASQVQSLNVAAVGIDRLTAVQVDALTTAQIEQVVYDDFLALTTTQITRLTASQLASIPNNWWFERIPATVRAALTAAQVQQLPIDKIGLHGLTATQIGQLSATQVQLVTYSDFGAMTPAQVPFLSATQLATIPNNWWFERMSSAARAALTAAQVQQLPIDKIGLHGLNETQVGQLSATQVLLVKYEDFGAMIATQVPHLSAIQLATIPNGWWFERMSSAARSVLSGEQVRALTMPNVGLSGLTDAQVHELSTSQISLLGYGDFHRLGPDEIVSLTGDQVATIPNTWWFDRMSEAARAALTVEQVTYLNVHEVSIRGLTSPQRDALDHEQIEELVYSDFQFVTAHQAEHLTREQMASIPNEWWFRRMTDEARAAFSRDQMLALSNSVMAGLVHQPAAMFAPHEDVGPMASAITTTDPTHDHTTTTIGTTTTTTGTTTNLPHQDDLAKQHEHLALFDLVPDADADFVSIANGNWSSPSTWLNGAVPSGEAQVLIAAGTTVTFDAIQLTPMDWVRVNGTLDWATTIDTQMFVETLVVDGAGTLRIGTEAAPKLSGTAARIVIADAGAAIDTTYDPDQLGRGVISHGKVEMWGENVTPFTSLGRDPRRGDTTLLLDGAVTNWRVGDRLVLTGTQYSTSTPQDEELAIVAVNGNTVTIDADDDLPGVQALRFDHTTPAGHDLNVYVANMNRNIVVMSQNPAINDRRGHVMFMHSAKVAVHDVGFYGLGRSDKRNPSNDPVFDHDGELLATTGLNPRGRYAVHFHRAGIGAGSVPAVIEGSVVVDSPGWGFVNHQSNVHMTDNVAFNVVGSGFVTEFGDEIGSFVHNLSIRNVGSGDGLESRQDIFDFGHGGHGFWFQGPGVEVIDNISTGSREAAFIFFTQSSKVMFKAENISDPSIAAGRTEVPVGSVPLKRVSGNIAFGSAGSGLETWFHLTHMNDGQSVIDNFTAWNVGSSAVFTPYTGRTTLRDITLIGNPAHPNGTAFNRNNVTNNITYERVKVYGFDVGINVPVNRATVIQDGHFEAVRAIVINSAEDTLRTVDIVGNPNFVTLTATQLGTRPQFDIFLDGSIDMKNRDIETYFSPDIVRLGTVTFNNHQVYYFKQAANYVPFPTLNSPSWIPPELKGKTNTELWEQYGIAPGGTIAPADAVQVSRINGLVGSRTTYLIALDLLSAKYTQNLSNYRLAYTNERGDRIVDPTPIAIREGWNLLTRQVDGHKRTFFVYGDITAPTFTLNTSRTDLRVNPLGLEFGIVIHGTVFDDSFGEMSFRREFHHLDELPIEYRADGTPFLTITFTIRDLAGNETRISLQVVLDPNAPIVPGTQQRDLPPRDMPRTLTELLEYYFLTGQTPGVL